MHKWYFVVSTDAPTHTEDDGLFASPHDDGDGAGAGDGPPSTVAVLKPVAAAAGEEEGVEAYGPELRTATKRRDGGGGGEGRVGHKEGKVKKRFALKF